MRGGGVVVQPGSDVTAKPTHMVTTRLLAHVQGGGLALPSWNCATRSPAPPPQKKQAPTQSHMRVRHDTHRQGQKGHAGTW